jgi:hydrogenase maturation protein HypF
MAENHLDGRVIGFALDGTGYGLDGNVWGGEVLAADYDGFDRLAHLDYVRMPGGSAAILEPRRMAISYLFHHFGRELWGIDIPFVRRLERGRTDTLLRLIETGANSPLTSSTGRLFDAVAALAGVREQVNYEAQAAIEIEAILEKAPDSTAYPLAIRESQTGWIIDTRPLFEEIIKEIQSGVSPGRISRRFHLGFVEVLAHMAELARDRTSLTRICMSGGSFQNVFLTANLRSRLEDAGFQVFTHSEVPCGDGGLSLGQALVAAHRAKT